MAQQNKNTMTNTNPLLCDPKQGICEIPGAAASTPANDTTIVATKSKVRILYFTDPICSSCWGIEPQLRRLKLEYGDYIDVEYYMGGLLPSWEVYNSGGISKPSDVAHHWDEVSDYYEMPIDGDVWLEDPLPSSYPPSIAFKAAQMQDSHKAYTFLRRVREMVFMEKKNITRWEHLAQAAHDAGLDSTQLKKDFEGPAQVLFQNDLKVSREFKVRGFPTLFFADENGPKLVISGFRPYEQFEETLLKLAPNATKTALDYSWKSIFEYYPTWTTKEIEVLTNMPRTEVETALNQLAEDKKITKKMSKKGPLWVKL